MWKKKNQKGTTTKETIRKSMYCNNSSNNFSNMELSISSQTSLGKESNFSSDFGTEFGTEFGSDFGTDIESELNINNQTGGFFNFLNIFGSNKNSNEKSMLQAAEQGNYDAVKHFVMNNQIENFGYQDSNGNTILHYIAKDYGTHNICPKLISKILDKIDGETVYDIPFLSGSNIIDIQNNKGNTAILVALKNGNTSFVAELDKRGANKTLKNNEGLHIDTETINDDSDENSNQIMNNQNNVSPVYEGVIQGSDENLTTKDIVDKIINTFNRNNVNNNEEMMTEGSLNFNTDSIPQNISKGGNSESPDTEVFLNNLLNKYDDDLNNNYDMNNMNMDDMNVMNNMNNMNMDDNMDTEKFLNDLANKYNNYDEGNVYSNNVNNMNDTVDTENFINEMISKYNVMSGGSHNNYSNNYEDMQDTEAFLNELRENYLRQTGGNIDNFNQMSNDSISAPENMTETDNLDNVITKLFNSNYQLNKQTGGSKMITGQRKLMLYSKYSDNGHYSAEISEDAIRRQYSDEMKTIMNKQVDEIRSRVINNVKNMLNVSKSKAKSYVDYIEGVLEEEMGETTNLDLSL